MATLLPSGKVLVSGGGSNSGVVASAELYDPSTNGWSSAGSLGNGRLYHTVTLLPSGKVLVSGGYEDNSGILASAELYDPATNGWSSAANLNSARYLHTTTLLPSGKVLVTGGYDNSGGLASAELYDPATNVWSSAGNLTDARAEHTATLLPSGKVLVTGGNRNSGAVASAELYDPSTNGWSSADSLGTGRLQHSATLLPSGKVLVSGGLGDSGPLASAELYDPVANGWSTVGSLGTGRYRHTATLLPSGKVLVAGGGGSGVVLASAELYDPVTNGWSSAGNPGTGRQAHTATLLPSGKVLFAGGSGNGGALASTELYDPATNVWSSAGSLVNARYGHTATLLLTGNVLVTGGNDNNDSSLASAELYDPVADGWSTVGSLGTARYLHTAMLLPDGKVLIAGGHDNSGSLASAELFHWELGAPITRQPVLSSASPGALQPGAALTLGGTLLRGDSEASGGSTNSSATNLPLVQLQRLDGGATAWLAPVTSSSTSYTSQPLPSSLASGWYALRAVVNGIASDALLVRAVTVPNPPTAVASSTGDGAVALTWAAPADDGGSVVTGYTVLKQAVPAGASTVACTTTGALGCTASGLTNGQAYSFTVRAANGVGDSTLSAAVQATPQQFVNPSVPLTGVPGGGNASVQIAGGPAGCTVGALNIDTSVPPGAPSNASFPLGVLRFIATGCDNATLTVKVTYPSAIPAAAQLRKYGPQTFGAPNSWFSPSGASISGDRLTATYQVTDNGQGDSDGTLGSIRDPFAPMVLAAVPGPSGVAAIPTLSEWGLILMSLMAAGLGMLAVRRRT
ncbi:IPTL-CTERM sorting domain-containing protein [Paracidovorax valerianellae]|uniref:IPTL-CTERM sorting domain-containing protein n=2 Tax=Paracidovorax valerianellae TaxID=187868 RepID=UPI001C319D61|nr:IPTL-CTERM sorting domain-containing protein [Paracidovorax valerianellae]